MNIPNNPITYNDIERCPYTWNEGQKYNSNKYHEWIKKDNERLQKIRKSWIRYCKRLFGVGAWHPNTQYQTLVYGKIVNVNEDLFL